VRELVEEVRGYVRQGFNTVKIKVRGLGLSEDLKRLRALRKKFGESLEIAVDANNVYSFNEALKASREFERLGVIFFEELIPTDYPGFNSFPLLNCEFNRFSWSLSSSLRRASL